MAGESNGTGAVAGYVDRRLIGGGTVLVLGGLLAGAVGATLLLVATVNAGRRYVADLDEPPRTIVLRRWGQAKSATVAGVGAWQGYGR